MLYNILTDDEYNEENYEENYDAINLLYINDNHFNYLSIKIRKKRNS